MYIDRKVGSNLSTEISIGNFGDKSVASAILSYMYMMDRKVGNKHVHFELSNRQKNWG